MKPLRRRTDLGAVRQLLQLMIVTGQPPQRLSVQLRAERAGGEDARHGSATHN